MSLIMEFCVQQFWACKFTVSLCLLLLVRRRELRRRELKKVETKRGEVTSRRIFFGHLVAEFVYIKFYYMETEQMFVRIVEWGDWFGWRRNCCVSSVSPYLRSLQSAIQRNCVVSTYHSVQWWYNRLWYNRFVLCELEFSSSWTLCLVRRA